MYETCFLSKYHFEILLLQRCGQSPTHVQWVSTSIGRLRTQVRHQPVNINSCVFKMPLPIENPANWKGVACLFFASWWHNKLQNILLDIIKTVPCNQNKRYGMLSKGIVLLLDNACLNTVNQTQDLIASFGWEQFARLPYSLDLSTKWL